MSANRKEWHNAYENELKEMFFLTLNVIDRAYPRTDVDIETAFHHFSRLIYHSSSKEISSYTKASLKPDDDLIKHGEKREGNSVEKRGIL
jgi:hypothetical protein